MGRIAFVISIFTAIFSVSAMGYKSETAQSKTPRFSEIVKGPNGYSIDTHFTQAQEICASMKGHVPTAREWAEYAMANGAVGIRETNFPDHSIPTPGPDAENFAIVQEMKANLAAGFKPVLKQLNGSGEGVEFYFSGEGFNRPAAIPAGDWSLRERFWTSSRGPHFGFFYRFTFVSDDEGNNLKSIESGGRYHLICAFDN